jgi:predicted dinucleotide-utilizing enzyme
MQCAPTTITLIGRGRIGSCVAEGLRGLPGYQLLDVLGRDARNLPAADITIDTAGPQALRRFGARALCHGALWTVGAAALIDPALRDDLLALMRSTGNRMHLFTGWISGPTLCPPGLPAQLFIRQSAPGLADRPGVVFRGPLADAAARFPDHLNTAMAAALCGPGIAATKVTIRSTEAEGPHRIAARFVMPGQTLRSEVRFDRPGPHPVASAILAALAHRSAPFALGGG